MERNAENEPVQGLYFLKEEVHVLSRVWKDFKEKKRHKVHLMELQNSGNMMKSLYCVACCLRQNDIVTVSYP